MWNLGPGAARAAANGRIESGKRGRQMREENGSDARAARFVLGLSRSGEDAAREAAPALESTL
jgi:hypothetical protein